MTPPPPGSRRVFSSEDSKRKRETHTYAHTREKHPPTSLTATATAREICFACARGFLRVVYHVCPSKMIRFPKRTCARARARVQTLPRELPHPVHKKRPRGSYVMLLSMQDRLSGSPLKWSESGSYSGGGFGAFPAATRPVRHLGRHHDVDLLVRQSVFALCPSSTELRPGNVLILELFRLADKRNPRDRVVGWAALPVSSDSVEKIYYSVGF